MLHLQTMSTEAQIVQCYPLMKMLRTTLEGPQDFLAKVRQQAAEGYRLMALLDEHDVVALAGYRCMQNLVHGRFVYVDDLVTDSACRGQQLGSRLFNGLVAEARLHACDTLILDSGLTNALAHRFYYRQGMLAKALHFSLSLKEVSG